MPPPTPAELEALAELVVAGALHEGYLRYAARVWMRLPAEVRETLRSRPLLAELAWRVTDGADGGVTLVPLASFTPTSGEPRERLAVALAAAGHLEEARRVPVKAPGAVLRCLLGTPPADPLELTMTLAPAHFGDGPGPEFVAAALPCVAPEEALLAWSAAHLARPERDPTLPLAAHDDQLEALRPLAEAVARLPPPPSLPGPPLAERGCDAWPWPKVEVRLSSDGGHALMHERDALGGEKARLDRTPDGGWRKTVLTWWIH